MSRTRTLAAVLISSALSIAPASFAVAATTPAAATPKAQPFKLTAAQVQDLAAACKTASGCNAFVKAFMNAVYRANPTVDGVMMYQAVGVAFAAAYNANPALRTEFAFAFDRLSRAATEATGIPATMRAYAAAARAGSEITFTATASAAGQTALNNPGSPA